MPQRLLIADEVAALILIPLDHNLDGVANLELGRAGMVDDLLQRNQPLGLQTDIDHHVLVGDLHDSSSDDGLIGRQRLGCVLLSRLLTVEALERSCEVVGVILRLSASRGLQVGATRGRGDDAALRSFSTVNRFGLVLDRVTLDCVTLDRAIRHSLLLDIVLLDIVVLDTVILDTVIEGGLAILVGGRGLVGRGLSGLRHGGFECGVQGCALVGEGLVVEVGHS